MKFETMQIFFMATNVTLFVCEVYFFVILVFMICNISLEHTFTGKNSKQGTGVESGKRFLVQVLSFCIPFWVDPPHTLPLISPLPYGNISFFCDHSTGQKNKQGGD